MTLLNSSTIEISQNFRNVCYHVYLFTIEDNSRKTRLDLLGNKAALLEKFVYGYTSITDPTVDTDDEILNWAFSEVLGDFIAALWNISSGFYKAGASSLRNALDLGFASLYFQVRENTDPGQRRYNKFFAEWDAGLRNTPNWGESKQFLSQFYTVKKFNSQYNCNIIDEIYTHFKYLCNYTHSVAFTPEGDPVTAINSVGVWPSFDQESFNRMCDLADKTISWLAIIWQVVFPQIIETKPFGPLSSTEYKILFGEKRGTQARVFRK